MLSVSESAKEELQKILFAKVDNPVACVRLIRGSESDSYGFTIDIKLPGDQAIDLKGTKALVVDLELSKSLDGNLLDVEDNVSGKSFVILEGG